MRIEVNGELDSLAPAIDTAIARSIKISERTNLSLRMEAFNVFNHPELGSPTVNLSSPSFGQMRIRCGLGHHVEA